MCGRVVLSSSVEAIALAFGIADPAINKALNELHEDLSREPVIQEDREKRDELLLRRKGLRL